MDSSMNPMLPLLQRTIGSDVWNELRDYFMESWSSGDDLAAACRYRVYLAQKGMNLNEIFWREEHERIKDDEEKKRFEETREKYFCTQSGIVAMAKPLVEAYLRSGCECFPRIDVYDEFAHTGRDFAALFYELRNVVLREWRRRDKDESRAERQLLNAFSAAIRFRPFYTNATGLIIEDELRNCVCLREALPMYRWFPYIQRVSKALTLATRIENTAFIPTFFLAENTACGCCEAAETSGAWLKQEWNYNGCDTTIWHKKQQYGRNGVIHYHYALRTHYDKYAKQMCVTPYVFWDGISEDALQRLWKELYEYFSTIQACSHFSALFKSALLELKNIKLQLLSAIASILLFFEWAGDGLPSETAVNSDIEKIAQSFGCIEQSKSGFEHILKNRETRRTLDMLLQHTLFSETRVMDRESEPDEGRKACYLRWAENYYSQVEEDETAAVRLRRCEGINFTFNSSFYNKYDGGLGRYLGSFPQGYDSFENKIAALLVLLEHGYVGQRIYAQENHTFYLNVGESTNAIRFNAMYRFLPALARIERLSVEKGQDALRCIRLFGKYLKQIGDVDLEEVFASFASRTYDNGTLLNYYPQDILPRLSKPRPKAGIRPVQEWDGKPWPEVECREFSSMSEEAYTEWEVEKQQYYYDKVAECFYI